MNKAFEFCIPTRGTEVPASPDWLHEIKYDGYRLRVERDGDRVRLITRNGYDWTKRYPWIVESALKNRQKHFVIDGEAVVLGDSGWTACPISTRYISASTMTRSSFTPSTCSRGTGTICARCPSQCARPILTDCWHGVPTGSLLRHSNKARSAPTYFGPPAISDLRASSRSAATAPIVVVGHPIGSKSRTEVIRR
jgi:ATP dependent DNA ligase domain